MTFSRMFPPARFGWYRKRNALFLLGLYGSGFTLSRIPDAQSNRTRLPQISSIEHVRDAAALSPAAISSSGLLVVSRMELSAMDVFDLSGDFVARIPRAQDHLSLVPPAPVAITPEGKILALDVRSGRLAHYSMRSGNLVLTQLQQIHDSYADLCVLDSILVMFTPETGGRLDLLPLDSRTLGRSIQTSSRRSTIEQPLNDARITCDAQHLSIIIANALDGSVMGLSPRQGNRWRVTVAGLRLPHVALNVGRSINITPPSGEYHSLIQCVALEEGIVLLQYLVHSTRVQPWGQMAPILTVAIAASDGREIARKSDLPFIVAAADTKIAYLGSRGRLIVGSSSRFVKALPSR